LKFRISQEIYQSESVNTLFRANSFASKMFTAYSKIVGIEYLWSTLAIIMHEINDMGTDKRSPQSRYQTSTSKGKSLLSFTSIEVDPNKMDEESDTVANQLQLQLVVHKVWKAIIESENDIPVHFREIFSHIAEEMPKRYDDRSALFYAVGGFFFLRFICPSLTTPHVYGLLEEPPNETAQRYVVLISKTLQNIANGTLPGKKEEYMASLNEFISGHIKEATEFFERLTVLSQDNVVFVDPYKVPNNAYENALMALHKHLSTGTAKINAALDLEPDSKEIKNKLNTIIQKFEV